MLDPRLRASNEPGDATPQSPPAPEIVGPMFPLTARFPCAAPVVAAYVEQAAEQNPDDLESALHRGILTPI